MNEHMDPGIASLGHSRAASEDVSMNGAHPVPSTIGEATESSTDSGFTSQGLIFLPKSTGTVRRRALQPTGVCYDDRMKLHMNVDWSSHDHHPEDPRRIEEIFNTFKESGLVFNGDPAEIPRILQDAPNKYMYRIAVREATKDEICLAHDAGHYDWVESLTNMSYQELRVITKIKDQGRDSLYVSSMSFKAALLSAGGAIEVAKHVVAGVLKNGFAIIRPPGHHAEYNHAMGFCFFNNVPVAARVCQSQFPEECRKVMILDWDVHHGNGVQNIFYDDPNVLYISLHVYQNGSFYPGRPEDPSVPDGGIENCGAGPGLGKNVNIGWHDQGMGDGEYMAAFQKIVMPIAQEFNPDLVIISAGFDAAKGDELGGCFVTPACYAHMTHMLMSLANGKVVVCLEGGYNLKAISQSALAVAHTLMGEPPPRMDLPAVNQDAQRMLAKVQGYQASYWECMRKGVVPATDLKGLDTTRLHDVIRESQLRQLVRRHKMTPLHIQKEALHKTFENQVLVTPGVFQARRLMIIIHDPPQIVGQLDIDNTLDPHNAFVVDEVVQYVDWAVKNKFAVMDINVPSYEEHNNENEPFIPRITERTLEARVQELMCYLWDNYIQLYSDAEIFLLGVGNAHVGVKALLTCRDTTERVSGIVNFVTASLKAVKSDIYPDLSSWYRNNSRVYVGDDHVCWRDPDLSRRVAKKRFGHVLHSSVSGLGRMMREHAGDVQEWVLERASESGDTTEDELMEKP